MTTGRLARALAHAVKAHDPQAAARRRERAQKVARVEVWAEPAGTAALAGRDLPPAGVIEATKSLDADARWLKAHGVPGSFDELRAKAFAALLAHKPLTSLIPAADAAAHGSGHAATPASPTNGGGPGITPGPDSTAPGSEQTGPRLGGTVHLTMPATAWLGLSDNPGDIPGLGPTDADTCRDLAGTLAANPATRWCITLTDPSGRAVAHGCARAGPGPPGPGRRAWLASVTVTPIAASTCDHRHQSAGYQPSHDVAAPGQNPQPPLRLSRLPAPRRPVRRRPYRPPPQGRPDVRMQSPPAVPPSPPDQAGTRLARRPAPARRPGLDHTQRPDLHHHRRALPHLKPPSQPVEVPGCRVLAIGERKHRHPSGGGPFTAPPNRRLSCRQRDRPATGPPRSGYRPDQSPMSSGTRLNHPAIRAQRR